MGSTFRGLFTIKRDSKDEGLCKEQILSDHFLMCRNCSVNLLILLLEVSLMLLTEHAHLLWLLDKI